MVLNIKKYFARFETNDNLSLMDVFRPLYVILCLEGLFPYLIKYPTSDNPRVGIKSIVFNAFCATTMTIVLCVLFALNITYYIHATEQMIYMININYIIASFILTSGVITTYIASFKNRKSYIYILNEISTMWQDLSLPEVKGIIKNCKFHVKVMVFGWLTVLLVWRATTFAILSNKSMFKESAYSLLPEILVTSIIGFFYVLVLMVASLLKNIEQQIQNLNNEERDDVLNSLVRLELFYTKAIEVKREINRIFEVIIALMLMEGFYATLRQAHGVYHALYHIKQQVYDIVLGIAIIIYPVSKLLAISYSGSMLKERVRNDTFFS